MLHRYGVPTHQPRHETACSDVPGLGLGQERCAEVLGVSARSVTRWEHNYEEFGRVDWLYRCWAVVLAFWHWRWRTIFVSWSTSSSDCLLLPVSPPVLSPFKFGFALRRLWQQFRGRNKFRFRSLEVIITLAWKLPFFGLRGCSILVCWQTLIWSNFLNGFCVIYQHLVKSSVSSMRV